MQKKIITISFFCVIVVVLACYTPALASKAITQNPDQTTIPIEVTRYVGKNALRTIASVSPANALQIKECLIQLSQAQQNNDGPTIARCITELRSYGIKIDKKDATSLAPQNIITKCKKMLSPSFLSSAASDNISNAVCFVNAIGQGMMYGAFAVKFLQEVSKALQNQTNPFLVIILLLTFLPLILIVILLNDLIPIRILMPTGILALANGSVSSIGLLGLKHQKVGADPIQANLSWFTGLTINIPPLHNGSKPFVFLSGFVLKINP